MSDFNEFLERLYEMCPELEKEKDIVNNFEGYFVSYDKFLERISHAWEGVPCYNNDPLELIVTLINERDEAIQENKKLKEQVERLENPWISCNDMLPNIKDNGGKVLLHRKPVETQKLQAMSVFDTNMIRHCDRDETHWMPLPNKPTER